VLIQRRLGRLRFRQDAVDAHGPNALLVKQPIGGVEEAVSDRDLGDFRAFSAFLRHPLTIQTDRSIVNA